MADYSWTKGLSKGVKGAIVAVIAVVVPIAVAQLPEGMTIGTIVDKYATQFLGTAGIAGLITLASNWVKIKLKNE